MCNYCVYEINLSVYRTRRNINVRGIVSLSCGNDLQMGSCKELREFISVTVAI